MSEGNGSVYADVTKKYLKGKIPFRVWMLSAFLGASLTIIDNLAQHHAVLEGFFSTFFWNAVITIPIFIVQAHFVARGLQRNPHNAKRTLIICLLLSWTITGLIIGWVLALSFENGVTSDLWSLLCNWVVVMLSWWALSLWMFKLNK